MVQYIDKSALVAEIEKLINEIYAGRPFDSLSSEQQTALWYVKSIMSSINHLKVKEANLEKEVSKYISLNVCPPIEDVYKIAKHFFELGLKAHKNNIRHSMDETPNYPCDILFVTSADNMFLFRYMEDGRPVDRETPYFHNIQNGKCWYYCNDIVNIH